MPPFSSSSVPNPDVTQSTSIISEPLAWLERSHERAKADKHSWDFAVRSGIAGGIAGCVAKTAVAPLDRVKILFQTSNQDFKKYQGSFKGMYLSMQDIYTSHGVRGLLQGHLATLLRIFPYAGIKFMLYDRVHYYLMPTKASETSALLFTAGATSGIAAVFCTYPLELIRVRLAFQTRTAERTSLAQIVRQIYHENRPLPIPASSNSTSPATPPPPIPRSTSSPSSLVTSASSSSSASSLSSASASLPASKPPPLLQTLPLSPFYRGFSITLLGMIPYAGISFLTYGRLRSSLPTQFYADHRTSLDLFCGAVAGVASQTASYPFEVVRRRMQVGGALKGRDWVGWREAVGGVWKSKGWRGFYVGLGIGYLKVVPMTSISYATWQLMKRTFDI